MGGDNWFLKIRRLYNIGYQQCHFGQTRIERIGNEER